MEAGDTVLMFESPGPNDSGESNRGRRSGISLTICFSETKDLDALYAELSTKGVTIECEIGDRPWGNRDFTIRNPDGYKLILAKPTSQ